jgi:hypothetical protein
MADQSDVRRIALSLPGVCESDDHVGFSAPARGGKSKGMAWTWNERVEPKKPRVPNPAVLVVRVANQREKQALIAADPDKFFTEPHYNGFPAVHVRLDAVDAGELEELITDAWLAIVPARQARAFQQQRGG